MIYHRNLLSICLFLSLGSSLLMPLTVKCKTAGQWEQQKAKKLQIEIEAFLSSWLVGHDIEKSLRFFSVHSALNKMMLNADCAGYIKAEDRKSKAAIQAGTEKFLRDFASGNIGRSLAEQLNIARIIPPNPSDALNNVQKDRYLLVKLSSRASKKLIQEKKVIDKLRGTSNGKHSYISFIQIGDGVLYFVWVQDAGRWQIYHADIVCI